MKLNLHTIAHDLDDIVIGEIIGSDPNKPSIEYPVLFSVNEYHFYNNVLYVTIDKHLEEAKDRVQRYLSRNPNLSFSCICIGTPPSYTGAIPNCDIAWVDSSQSRTRLFNTIQKIFQRFTSWERGLEEIVNGGGGLSDLVNASLGIFKNDICITDQFSRVLVHRVYRTGQLLREQTDQIEEGKYLPKNMVFDGVLDEQGGMDFSSQEPTFATMHAFRCTVLRSTIKVSQGYSLILSVHSNYQEIGPYDCAPLLVFAATIKKLYSSYGVLDSNERYVDVRATMRSFIQGKNVPDSMLIQCAIAFDWSRETDELLCLCIDFIPTMRVEDGILMKPLASVCNRIQDCFDCLAFILENRIVVVVNCTRSNMTEEDLLDQTEQFAHEYGLAIGASSLYPGIKSLPGSYRQAIAALEKSYAEQSERIVRFEDNTLEIGMSYILNEMNPERFCPKALVSLARSEPELYRSLDAYLKANCNSSMASKALSLQRNSFVYRLEKIKRLLGMDLEDPDVRLLLNISFKLIDLYGLENLQDR